MTRKPSVPALPETRNDAGSRRKFLKAATGAAAAGAALGFPMIAKGQTGPISCASSRTWPTKDIFHEYALDYAKTRQRHDRRRPQDRGAAGRVPWCRPSACSTPSRRARSTAATACIVYHYGKQNALALWGSGPAYGMDANMLMAWHRYGGGKELLTKLYARSAPTSCRSRTVRWRRSRSAGSRSRSPRRTTSRASSTARSASRSTCSRRWARRSTRCRAAKSCRRWTAACSTRRNSTT